MSKVILKEGQTVKEFAEALSLPVTKVVEELIKNQLYLNVNETIDVETAMIIAEDLGFSPEREKSAFEKHRENIKDILGKTRKEELSEKPPVVAIMGHVDHGKTTLLDTIRKSNIVEGEHGGITQHIGAYTIEKNNKKITFLDTPGHEAFIAMRARGAKVTDIAVLVVAADDGVKDQTKEAYRYCKEGKVPVIVALNKIDKPDANIDAVKGELSNLGLQPEEWGGDAMMVSISAKKGDGIENLIDSILVLAETLELKTARSQKARGTVIEASISKTKGVEATVLIDIGTLSIGDIIACGDSTGTVRNIYDENGKTKEKILPGEAGVIIGLKNIVQAGDTLCVAINEREAKEIAKSQIPHVHYHLLKRQKKRDEKILNLIIKADVQGSLEAIIDFLKTFDHPTLKLNILKDGVGLITESDLMTAAIGNAVIIGFKTDTPASVKKQALRQKIEIKTFNVIYEIFDFLRKHLEEMIDVVIEEEETGKLKVLAVFRTEKKRMIVGGEVISGKVSKDVKVKILRAKEEIGRGNVDDVKLEKNSVKEVFAGTQCGISIFTDTKIKESDELVFYVEKEIREKLEWGKRGKDKKLMKAKNS